MRDLSTVELQTKGHDLIRELRTLGQSTRQTYRLLAKFLGDKNFNHFSQVKNSAQAKKIVTVLETMISYKKETGKFARISFPWLYKNTK